VETKLFYQDSYIQSFTAKVVSQQQDVEGNWFVVLEKTAFYPTGGGQPYDTGTLNDIQVVNVEEIEGEIRHYLERQLSNEAEEVFGTIDWNRRFDHMQQHAGQHILSAAFEEQFGFETVSFHLGKEVSTIDLSIENLMEQQAAVAEKLANQIILENRSIETKWLSVEEASTYPLRKKLSVTDDVRLVIIPDFDYNGCGGTHPHSTGQVGSLKILDWERQKKQVRIKFVCGSRVLSQLGQKQKVLMGLSPLLNAPEQDMISAVSKMVESAKERDRALEEAREQLLQYEAVDLLNQGLIMNEQLIISRVFQNRTIQELQKLARSITLLSAEAIVVLIAENEDRLQLVCAKGEAAEGSMKRLVGDLLPLISGKGGGNDMSAQGGGAAIITGEQMQQKAIEKLTAK
jgi:alanyl-tRNA synthetase